MLRTVAMAFVLSCAATAGAHEGGDGAQFGFGGRGFGFGPGGRHGFFDGGRGFGFGLSSFQFDRAQDRFEDTFSELMSDYETGVAETADFYTSDDYLEIVDDTELLSVRYGLFVSSVERNVDRLTDLISIANDDLTYYNDLLTEYQSDEDLSEARLERLENWIERITGRIDARIDHLTETQLSLEEILPDFLSFQTEVDTFLTDIVTAGGSTEVTASAIAMYAVSSEASMIEDFAAIGCEPISSALSAAVPEPRSAIMLLGLTAMLAIGHRRRRRWQS